MCWQCDHPDKTRSDYLDLLRDTIAAHGWVVQYVEDDRRSFAYTIGLHDRGHPEYLVTGLPPKQATWLLNLFARRTITFGRIPTPGEQISLTAATRVELVAVEHPDAHLYGAVDIGGSDIRAIQLVWADDRGRWPWAPDFDGGHGTQPVLGARVQKA